MTGEVRLEHLQEWIESSVDVTFDGNMWALLKDGQVLCKLANSLNAAIRINKLKTSFHCKENIQAFINWAKSVGVPSGDLFTVHDLQFEENLDKVLATLSALYNMYAEEIRASIRFSASNGAAGVSMQSGSYISDDDSGFEELHDSEPDLDDEPDLYDLSIVRENRSSSKLAAFLKFVPIQTTTKHIAMVPPLAPEHIEPAPEEIPLVVKAAPMTPPPKAQPTTPPPKKQPTTPPPRESPPPVVVKEDEPAKPKTSKFSKLSNFLHKAKKASPKAQTPGSKEVQTPQSKSSTPQSKASTPHAKFATPKTKPTTPKGKPTTPKGKPSTPKGKPATPKAKAATPNSTTQNKVAIQSPQAKVALSSPETNLSTPSPQLKLSPQPKLSTPPPEPKVEATKAKELAPKVATNTPAPALTRTTSKIISISSSRAAPVPFRSQESSSSLHTPPASPKSSTGSSVGTPQRRLSAFLAKTPPGKPTLISAPSATQRERRPSLVGSFLKSNPERRPSLVDLERRSSLLGTPSAIDRRPSLVGSTPPVLDRRPSLVGSATPAINRRPSLLGSMERKPSVVNEPVSDNLATSRPMQLGKPRGPNKTKARSGVSPPNSAPVTVVPPPAINSSAPLSSTNKLANFLKAGPPAHPTPAVVSHPGPSKLANFLKAAPPTEPQRMLANIMMNRVPQSEAVVTEHIGHNDSDSDDELCTPPSSPKAAPAIALSTKPVAKAAKPASPKKIQKPLSPKPVARSLPAAKPTAQASTSWPPAPVTTQTPHAAMPQPSPVQTTNSNTNKLASFMAAVPPPAAHTAAKSSGTSKLAAFLSKNGMPKTPSTSFVGNAPSTSFVAKPTPPSFVSSAPPTAVRKVRAAPVRSEPRRAKRSTMSGNWVQRRYSYKSRKATRRFDKEGTRRTFLQTQLRLKEETKHSTAKHHKTANVCAPGMLCYVPDDTDTWLLAEVDSVDTRRKHVKVKLIEGDGDTRTVDLTNMDVVRAIGGPQATEIDSLPLAISNPIGDGVEDMRNLRFLNEPSILYNLKRRFEAAQPYTYSNDIVIAVNPYQWLGALYGEQLHTKYLKQPRHNLPPHVYSTSTSAYKSMTNNKMNQSILVSGESGAGKTETTKILMNHLATVAGGREDKTIARVIDVNPLLESFGNAKTLRNDNSSRFGKFTQLQFSAKGVLRGACCETYLLEKSRVVSFAPGERNYHIFYQILAGLPKSMMESLRLDGDKKYRYIGDLSQMVIDGIDDSKWMAQTQKALGLIDLDSDFQKTLFEVLAGILHVGEVDFVAKNETTSKVSDPEALAAVADLLGLSTDTISQAFCNRTVVAHRDSVIVPLNVIEAAENRDALAKAIYASLFDWLVKRINEAMSIPDAAHQIGVLDIFGFEDFAHNGFEQFCINYANEKLQQKFVQDVFSTVQDEYTREGLVWDHISYADNQNILDLIEGKLGIINLMNDHLRQPRGTEEALVNKFRTKDNNIITFAKVKRTQFTIRHYAGAVTYETIGFMEKHRDALMQDLLDLVRSSTKPFVVSLFPTEPVPEPAVVVEEPTSPLRHPWLKKAEPKPLLEGRKKALPPKTLGSQFKASLTSLMETISVTQVHYVRCIKPNSVKSPTVFDKPMVVSQLRSAGVIDAIRISRAGYPSRLTSHELATRYATMLPPSMIQQPTMNQTCEAFMRATGHSSPVEYQMGKTLVYFKAGVLEELELMKSDFYYEQATLIQKVVLGFIDRQAFQKKISAAIKMQSFVRRNLERIDYVKIRSATIKMQRVFQYYKNEKTRREEALAALRQRLKAEEEARLAREAKEVKKLQVPSYDMLSSALSSPRSLMSPMTSPEASDSKGSFRSQGYYDAQEVETRAKDLLAQGDAFCGNCKNLSTGLAHLQEQLAKLKAENVRLRRLLVDHSINPDEDDGVYV
ncbi:myosin [Thraustotheca clavata]|uniref:Myosin n=1 Tax=Thraustotheca clavata TaxID=74557 RepID=A0A1V9ZVV2_9STRA|nr:myosin [Thraustotheca clavata]